MSKVLSIAKLIFYITAILFLVAVGTGVFYMGNALRQIPHEAFDQTGRPRVVRMDGGVTCYIQSSAMSCVQQ